MTIDLRRETVVDFNEAARYLPGGVRPNYATWWRWSRRGLRGVRLETLAIGRRRVTSVEAAQERFFRALADAGELKRGHDEIAVA